MSLTFPTDTLKKPSGLTAIPNQFNRPAFGTLYGFDAQGLQQEKFNITTRLNEAALLATSPTNPTDEVNIGFGLDSYDFYVYDGADWYIFNNDT